VLGKIAHNPIIFIDECSVTAGVSVNYTVWF